MMAMIYGEILKTGEKWLPKFSFSFTNCLMPIASCQKIIIIKIKYPRTARHILTRKSGPIQLCMHLGTIVGYIQNKFERLAMFLLGTKIERWDLNECLLI